MRRYERIRELGHGGFASVWLARDRQLGRDVAMKILSNVNPTDLERFQREARAAAALSHPNLVAIYDIGEANGEPYIVMEYVAGGPAGARGLSPRQAADVVRQAAEAVHHAHERGVVHRDLKPQNILLDEGLRARVTDFGLAKSLGDEVTLSVTGDIIGSPSYMAPEQARGRHRETDARTDVWGLGATLYALLAGRPPFREGDALQTIVKVLRDDPPPLPPEIDRDLRTIVGKCLEKGPARRYASALDVARDLQRYLNHEPIAARPPSIGRKLVDAMSRHRAAALALLALAAGGAFGGYQWFERQRLEQVVVPMIGQARDLAREADAMKSRPDFHRERWSMRLAEAERLCRDALALHDAAEAYLVLGQIELHRGRLSEAVAHFDAALARNAALDEAYLGRAGARIEELLAAGNEVQGGWQSRDLTDQQQSLLKLALDDLSRVRLSLLRDEEQALAGLLRRMLEDSLDDPRAAAEALAGADERVWRFAGEACHRLRRFDDAAACFQRYTTVRSGDVRALLRYAHMLGDVDEYARAERVVASALKIQPGDREALTLAALHLLKRSRFDEALAVYDGLIEGHPDDVDLRNLRGDLLRVMKRCDRAREDLDRAIELDPTNGDARNNLGLLLADLGRVEEARAAWREAVRVDPQTYAAHFNLGFERYEAGDVETAERHFNDTIDAAPMFPDPYNFRGSIRSNRGEVESALADFDAAIERGGEDRSVRFNRGNTLGLLDRHDEAIADLTRALELSPRWADAHMLRGRMYIDVRDFRRAAEDFERAIEFGTSDPDARGALEYARRMIREEF